MIRVNKIFGDRAPGTGHRMTTWVVEGEKNNQPGMIRRVSFDKDGGNPWINVEWTKDETGARNRLAGYDLRSDMRAAGAFFLEEAYAEVGKPEAYDYWVQFQKTCAPGDEFPDAWLPPKVLELRKIHKDKRRSATWTPPEGSLMGGDAEAPDELDEAPVVAGGTVTEKPKRGRRSA